MIKDNIQISGKTNAIIKSMHLKNAVKVEFSYDYTVTPCRMTVKVFYKDSEKVFNLRIPESDTSWVKWFIEQEIKDGKFKNVKSING